MLNHSLYPENYRQIGESFVMEYYDTMQRDRSSLKLFYHNQARMTYEGDVLVGQDKIGEKFLSLPANKIQVGITNVDVHPNENSVLIFVCGQVQVRSHTSLTPFNLINTPGTAIAFFSSICVTKCLNQ
ncbi:unnamed protein product [Schistosoma guineensis]|nr:unnamed protein product [Schistosoma guineensis]